MTTTEQNDNAGYLAAAVTARQNPSLRAAEWACRGPRDAIIIRLKPSPGVQDLISLCGEHPGMCSLSLQPLLGVIHL